MRIAILSNHYYRSKRKAGFHHLADAWCALGHEVTFITTGFSLFSYLRHDPRTRYPDLERNKLVTERPGLYSYVHFTTWHPHTLLLPFLDRLTGPYVTRYERFCLGAAEAKIAEADLVVYESCCSLFLVDKCRMLAPGAKHVYRVSDDITAMRSMHPRLEGVEQEIAKKVDLISTPCEYLQQKFSGQPNALLQPHGMDTSAYDAIDASPYLGRGHLVFVGNSLLDFEFLRVAAEAFPDLSFHILGPFARVVGRENIYYYGELSFRDTIAYVKFADVGLCTIATKNMEYLTSLTDSLKVKQYRYCGLPIIASGAINMRRSGVFYYERGNRESIVRTVRAALSCPKNEDWKTEVNDWKTVAGGIIHASGAAK